MAYDEQSFLQGVIVGMTQKGYAAYTKYADGNLLPPPTATPPPGTYYVFMPEVTLHTDVEGAIIKYTDDGASPILDGKRYDGRAWIVDRKTTIGAWALTASGFSRVMGFEYDFENPLAGISDDVICAKGTVALSEEVDVVLGFGQSLEDQTYLYQNVLLSEEVIMG